MLQLGLLFPPLAVLGGLGAVARRESERLDAVGAVPRLWKGPIDVDTLDVELESA